MLESGHSRIPVYGEDLDHIEGIAYSRDFLGLLSRDPNSKALAGDHMRPAMLIPEAKNLEELLNEFQARQVHLAIVIDEYGGVSGLVTIEDLLEEIVGEIQDEFDVDELEIQAVGRDEYLMDARVSIDQLDELLGIVVEADGFDTVGGFVYDRLGRIPSLGDLVVHDGLRVEVVSTVGRRLKKLRVSRSS
jgi:CBS domain containing-hemolysin-like protein